MAEQMDNSTKFITGTKLKEEGLSYYRIKCLTQEGYLKKVNHTTYENLHYVGEENDFYSASSYVPKGVICLLSAASYYGLSHYVPDAVDIAIDRKARVTSLPDSPRLRLYYFDAKRLRMGRKVIHEGNNSFVIFDCEKTIIDILAYRNKVGIEEMKEILTTYLTRKDRDLNRLDAYAKALKCEKILRTYLEVLV